MKVTVSVPGKVILMGEHAVVYGKPALIAAIDKRLTVTVDSADKLNITASEGRNYISHIIDNVCNKLGISDVPQVKIGITSEIPAGYHLGSSAAVAAGVTGALIFFLKKIWNVQLINQLAYESEKMIHINSSGVDPAAVTSGGFIWYRKELDFLRCIWQLPLKLSANLNNFYLVDTGMPKENTGEMVAYVSSKLKVKSSKFQNLFKKNEEQVKRIVVAIKEEKEQELIDGIRIGERTLEKMGVVSPRVIPLVRSIESSGGAAKILGGGGRTGGVGYLLCYHPDPVKLAEVCRPVKPIGIKLGEEGVRLEK